LVAAEAESRPEPRAPGGKVDMASAIGRRCGQATDDASTADRLRAPVANNPRHALAIVADSRRRFLELQRAIPMDVLETIRTRRSIKQFTDRPISRVEIERLLEAAVQAPNHRMTQPWRFYVLGPKARRAYGEALGARKAKRVEDPEAARAVAEKVAAGEASLPALIAVSMTLDENPEIREEDYAATMMGVENLLLAAHALGLGTHLKTGAMMADPRARAAVGVLAGERIVAIIQLGESAATPEAKPRRPAAEFTSWVP
jgi:nitroreductase